MNVEIRYRKIGAMRFCWSLICIFGSSVAHSADFSIGDFTLKIPDAFQSHLVTKPMERRQTHVFTIEAAAVPKPVVTIVMRLADRPAIGLKSAELFEIAKSYAADWVAAAERRRTEFKTSEPHKIMLAGRPAVDIIWTGKMNGAATSGRLFVMATETALYFFQVMGVDPPTVDMLAAIQAIKALHGKSFP